MTREGQRRLTQIRIERSPSLRAQEVRRERPPQPDTVGTNAQAYSPSLETSIEVATRSLGSTTVDPTSVSWLMFDQPGASQRAPAAKDVRKAPAGRGFLRGAGAAACRPRRRVPARPAMSPAPRRACRTNGRRRPRIAQACSPRPSAPALQERHRVPAAEARPRPRAPSGAAQSQGIGGSGCTGGPGWTPNACSHAGRRAEDVPQTLAGQDGVLRESVALLRFWSGLTNDALARQRWQRREETL